MNPNSKVTISQMLFRNLYFRYQAFLTPISVIFVCFLLFYFLVIPQIQNWMQIRDSLSVDVANASILHQNLSTVSNMNDATLTQLLSTATSALPAEKDFAGIISSIQTAANISGAALGDYAFQLGDLSGVDQNGKLTQLPVQLNVILKGDVYAAQRFVAQLKRQLPLSDTVAIAVSGNSSITATVVFYYASLPKIVFQDTQPLPVLGSADTTLLQDLANGNNLQNAVPASFSSPTPSVAISPTAVLSPTFFPTPVASVSATPTPVASGSAQ